MSLIERGPADTVLALAFIHHLAIVNNLPFEKIAEFFAQISKFLIIEFVPKNDPQVKELLVTRDDIFPDYTQDVLKARSKDALLSKRRRRSRTPEGSCTWCGKYRFKHEKTARDSSFLFAVFPILFLYAIILGRLLLRYCDPLIASLVLLFCQWSCCDCFSGSHKGGLITTFFLVLFFSYGYTLNVIYGWRIGNFIISRHRYLLFTWGTLFIFSSYLAAKSRSNLTNFTKFLNNASLSIVLIATAPFWIMRLSREAIEKNTE